MLMDRWGAHEHHLGRVKRIFICKSELEGKLLPFVKAVIRPLEIYMPDVFLLVLDSQPQHIGIVVLYVFFFTAESLD